MDIGIRYPLLLRFKPDRSVELMRSFGRGQVGVIKTDWTYALGRQRVLKGLTLVLALLVGPYARAGLPFQTDDPEPVGFRHYEAYLFGTFDRAGGGTFLGVPAVEFNWGAAPNLQVHIIMSGCLPVSERCLWDWRCGARRQV